MVNALVSRRSFIEKLAATAVAMYLPGCASKVPINICQPDIRRGDPLKPLSIDVHAHFFNASDVQVEGLLKDVISEEEDLGPIVKALSGTLENLLWTFVPNARREDAALKQIRQALAKCGSQGLKAGLDDDVTAVVRNLRQQAYADTLRELTKAHAKAMISSRSFATSQIQSHLEAFPESAEDYFFRKQRLAEMKVQDGKEDPTGVYNFVFRQSQYRCVNFIDYLHTVGTSPGREIDFIATHLLDFDWPLGDGNPTATTVPQQIKLMRDLSILSGGRVHCFAPFDPMKAAMHRSGRTPLDIVKRAVENDGIIGVKIYPPMGFAPYGNAEIQRSSRHFWKRRWLPASLDAVPDLGRRMDEKLLALYRWCQEHEVPIMSHTNVSMGAADDFKELVGAEYWSKAIGEVPELRVNFAHFGNTRPGKYGIEKNQALMNLMSDLPGSKGVNLYADSAYFSEILKDRAKLRTALVDLKELFRSNSPRLFDRFMFGTDWTMSALLGDGIDSYLSEFESMLGSIDSAFIRASDSDQFFGWNAAAFLGLRKGEGNRRRLDKFYSDNSVPQPVWMDKVDQIPALA